MPKLIVLEPAMVLYTCNSNTIEAEAGGSQFKCSLGYIMKSCLKKTMIVMIMITDKRGYYTE
jgi:hypothetical protein